MRRSPEILILLVLLAIGIIGVSWYVIDRRAKNRAEVSAAAARAEAKVLELGAATERKTVDFTSGQPVITDGEKERAAIDAAVIEMNRAQAEVVFEMPQKTAPPTPPANTPIAY